MNPSISLHFGGPVAGPIFALHVEPLSIETQGLERLTVAVQQELVCRLLANSGNVRLMIGHAGWQPGQLEQEIQAGYWYTLPANPEIIANAHEDMWYEWVRKCAGVRLAHWVGGRLPPEPTWN